MFSVKLGVVSGFISLTIASIITMGAMLFVTPEYIGNLFFTFSLWLLFTLWSYFPVLGVAWLTTKARDIILDWRDKYDPPMLQCLLSPGSFLFSVISGWILVATHFKDWGSLIVPWLVSTAVFVQTTWTIWSWYRSNWPKKDNKIPA